MANKPKSKSRESYSALYKSSKRETTNRKKKLLKLAKLQPNNEQITKALLDLDKPHRVAPKVPHWSASMIATAKLVKEFAGKVHKDYFSPDEKKRAEARRVSFLPEDTAKVKPVRGYQYGMFSIAKRIEAKGGTPWSI